MTEKESLLAVDTSGDVLSLALEHHGRVWSFSRKLAGSHDETLIPQVKNLLRKARAELKDLGGIAVANGPGRFTGLRVGMAFAAVAAKKLGIKAVAVTRLEALAFRCDGGDLLICAALSGWRGEMYHQNFRRRGVRWTAEGEPQWTPAALWPGARRRLEKGKTMVIEGEVRARDLLGPATAFLSQGKLPPFEPLYLKPAGYMLKK